MTDTAEIRQDMAETRERMSRAIDELKSRAGQRLDVMKIVKDRPWPSLGVAVALGAVIGGSGADEKAAAATAGAVRGAIEKLRSDDGTSESKPVTVESDHKPG